MFLHEALHKLQNKPEAKIALDNVEFYYFNGVLVRTMPRKTVKDALFTPMEVQSEHWEFIPPPMNFLEAYHFALAGNKIISLGGLRDYKYLFFENNTFYGQSDASAARIPIYNIPTVWLDFAWKEYVETDC